MTVSAVIAVYKPSVEKLNRCLSAVLPQVEEVIVCGDQDTPWPIQGMLEHENIKLIRHPQHATGYGKKATLGAMHATGDLLHFLNDDVYLGQNVIVGCKMLMQDNVAIVTHTLRYPDNRIQYAGKFRQRGMLGFAHQDHRRFNSRHKKPIEQESACGASMMIRREVFMDVNGFDEVYHLYSEDDDLVMRIRQQGYKVIFNPAVEGIHEEHSSMGHTPEWRQIMARSNKIFADRWKFYFDDNQNPNVIGKFKKPEQEIRIGRDGAIILRRKIAAGDVLLTTPIIAALKRECPERQVFIETDYPEIFRGNPNVSRAAKAISLPHQKVQRIDLTMAYESRLHLDYLSAYAEAANVKLGSRTPEIFLNSTDRNYAIKTFGREDRWCVINAGNPCTNRVWPLEKYDPVIRHLKNIGFKVASVGKFEGPKDCNLDLCKSTTIHQMAALIEYCGLFIGIDSFPLHVACATGSTAIGLFGVTEPVKVLSDASNVWCVTSDDDHPFTGARHRIVTDDSVICESNPMETIYPEQVVNAINECVFRI